MTHLFREGYVFSVFYCHINILQVASVNLLSYISA